MTHLFGKDYSHRELLRRIGNIRQIAGIREYTYASGRSAGVRAFTVNTGYFEFEVLASRCLDVSHGKYKGVPFGYISKSGVRHPSYFNKSDPTSFLDNFCGGVLTTCGLHNFGPAAERGGRTHNMHGEVANCPADLVSVSETWEGDDCEFVISGEMRHSRFYGEDLVLRRRIIAELGKSSFVIEDEVENEDFSPGYCLLLYHANFGFPFLDAATRLITSPRIVSEPRPGILKEQMHDFDKFANPADGENEICVYHTFEPDAEGFAGACLFNPDLGEKGMGVYIRYDMTTLPRFVQWKMLRSREYVCGLEPATAALDDLDENEARAAKIMSGEKRTFRVEIGVAEGLDKCSRIVGCKEKQF